MKSLKLLLAQTEIVKLIKEFENIAEGDEVVAFNIKSDSNYQISVMTKEERSEYKGSIVVLTKDMAVPAIGEIATDTDILIDDCQEMANIEIIIVRGSDYPGALYL